jgi:hypothetical protein
LAASVINHILSDWDADDSEKVLPDLDSTDLEGLVLKVVHIPRSRPSTPEEKEVVQETVRKIEHHISNETSLILRAEIMSSVFAEEDSTFNCPIIDPPYESPPPRKLSEISEDNVSKRTLQIVGEIEAMIDSAEAELKAKEKPKPKTDDDLPELTYEERLARRFKFAEDDEKMRNISTRVERIETRKGALMEGMENVISNAMKLIEQQGDEKKESVMAALNKIDKKLDKELANKRESVSEDNSELTAKAEMMHLLDFLKED